MDSGIIEFFLYFTYLLIGVAVVSAVVLPLISAAGNPKSLMRSGMGIIGLIVLFFIGYALSSGDLLPTAVESGVTSSGQKMIGGLIILTYILTVIAILGIAFSGLFKAFK